MQCLFCSPDGVWLQASLTWWWKPVTLWVPLCWGRTWGLWKVFSGLPALSVPFLWLPSSPCPPGGEKHFNKSYNNKVKWYSIRSFLGTWRVPVVKQGQQLSVSRLLGKTSFPGWRHLIFSNQTQVIIPSFTPSKSVAPPTMWLLTSETNYLNLCCFSACLTHLSLFTTVASMFCP